MTVKEAAHIIKESIKKIYELREINAITDWILEDLTKLKRVDRILFDQAFTTEQELLFNDYVEKLSKAMPVQYITGYTWFRSKKIEVNEHVLIPRPETEELVGWALESLTADMYCMDIGTGSGCIPLILKSEMPSAEIFAVEVSKDALEIAKKNTTNYGAEIHFIEQDILDERTWEMLPDIHMIISNPPYIPLSEKNTMDEHVVNFEPHLALFVSEKDPLIFYRKILQLAKIKLHSGGKVFLETHFSMAKEVATLINWPSVIRKDTFGKERMVCFTKP